MLTDNEFEQLLILEQELGITRMDLMRQRLLVNTGKVLVNAKKLLDLLDASGNTLGQIREKLNVLMQKISDSNEAGLLQEQTMIVFNSLLSEYIIAQRSTDKLIRQIIRLMMR
ncbi:hypothetical protein GCM10023149_37900 [Mucilaginibacter gynuensis]|uniref:Uncharacterized protein n=2 Tax=Mucilaginibacter gynuensis TaxID=1302236 RepID=A0ABP8GYM3_9SPHI